MVTLMGRSLNPALPEMGREFGSAETPQFINGVLDAIWRTHPMVKIARAAEEKKDNKGQGIE